MKGSVVKLSVKLWLFVCCFALLGWMVVKTGPMRLWQTLMDMPGCIAGCVFIWSVGYLFNSMSFRQVLLPTSIAKEQNHCSLTWWQIIRVTISGYALNYITPFGLLGGEPYRILVLRQAIGAEKATQSVVLYSMMHMASHFCLWLLSIVWTVATLQEIVSDHYVGVVITIVVVTALLSLFWYLYRHGIMLRFMQRWVNWPLLNPNILPAGNFVKALGYEILSRLVNVMEYWLIMQVLGFDTFGYGDALLVVAFSSLFANILFFSPLQMGTREGGIFLALQYLVPSLGLNSDFGASLLAVAVTLSFATRLREFIWIAIGLCLMRMRSTIEKDN